MLIIKDYNSIKLGRTIHPEGKLPYIKVTIPAENKTIDVGSVIWDVTKKQWELRSREEAEEMVKKMDGEKRI